MRSSPFEDPVEIAGREARARGVCPVTLLDVCYGDMHPRIAWERTKTLGYGYDRCDFKVRIKEG